MNWAVGVVGVLALLSGAWLLVDRYDAHKVRTLAMDPALREGEVALAAPVTAESALRRGDVVLVRGSAWQGGPADLSFPFRVVAVGGDRIQCCDEQGRIVLNGQTLAEGYIRGDTAARGRFSVEVPRGRLFLLGDGRDLAADSRSHLSESSGTVDVAQVQARLVAVAWPPWRARALPDDGAFDDFETANSAARHPVYLYAIVGVGLGLILIVFAARTWLASLANRLVRRRRRRPAPGTIG